MKLTLDHHYSRLIAEGLCERGLDAVAAIEAGWEAEDDEPLLALCVGDQRALLTNNVADFVAIQRRWHGEGRSHHGLVFTSDASVPRARKSIGRYLTAIETLMRDHPSIDGLLDRVYWL